MDKVENTSRRSWTADWCDSAPPEVRRRYLRDFLLCGAAYGLVLVVSIKVLNAFPQAPWRFPVALAPMVPMFFMLRVYLWYLRQIDELQRRIQLEALAFAFGGTALTTFGYGFLQNVGFPEVSWFFVWPVMSTFWGVGHWIAARRYR